MTTQENEIIENLEELDLQTKCSIIIKKTFRLYIGGVIAIIIIMFLSLIIYGFFTGFDNGYASIGAAFMCLGIGFIGTIILSLFIIGLLIYKHRTKKQIIEKGCIKKIIIVCIFGPILVGFLVFGGCLVNLSIYSHIN